MSAHFTAHMGECKWSDGDLIITDSEEAAPVRAGNRLRRMDCISCLAPVGAKPVQVMHIAVGEMCSFGHKHLCGLAVFIHAECKTPDDDMLLDRIGALLEHHRG